MKRNNKKDPEFDDVIFQDRNKEYGAYDLRRRYGSTMSISIVAGMIFGISLVLVPFFSTDNESHQPGSRIVVIATPGDKIPDPPPPPPVKPKPPETMLSQTRFLPPEIVDPDIIPVDTLPVAGLPEEGYRDKAPDTGQVSVPEPEPIAPPEPKIYIVVPEMPSFPGGDAALAEFLKENTRYPDDALANRIEGKVILQFVVGPTGEITMIKVIRSADPLLDNEAIRVISSMPKWRPGKNNGNPVPVYFSLPVTFQIK